MVKRKSRIRQTQTSFQKAFEHYDNIAPIGYWPSIPEFIHISLTLIDNSFEVTRSELFKIADYFEQDYSFNYNGSLSQLIEKALEKESHLQFIQTTNYGESLRIIFLYYARLIGLPIQKMDFESFKKLQKAYFQINSRLNDKAVLCKHIITLLNRRNTPDPTGHFVLHDEEYIISSQNKRMLNTLYYYFTNRIVNTAFCDSIWLYNYMTGPFFPPKDDTMAEEKRFKELKINELKKEFELIVTKIQEIEFILIYPRSVAEVIIGFISRITGLCLDTIELVEIHKGEFAEAALRLIYESRVKFLWLILKQDQILIQRFREYKVGRDKFMIENIKRAVDIDKKGSEKIIESINEEYEKTLYSEGKEDYDVAEERGDVFEKKLLDLALELDPNEVVWYEGVYQRTSDIIHGNWRIIEKYHLERSLNPIQNGLLNFSKNRNKFAGVLPAFLALMLATDSLIRYFELEPELVKTKQEVYKILKEFNEKLISCYMAEFDPYQEK